MVSSSVAWLWLLAAGVCEVAWAWGLKRYGFTLTSLGGWMTVGGMVLSFVLLSQAMKALPLGTAYAVWTGIGAAGTAVVGMTLLGESADWRRVVCVGAIVGGVVGLRVLGGK